MLCTVISSSLILLKSTDITVRTEIAVSCIQLKFYEYKIFADPLRMSVSFT